MSVTGDKSMPVTFASLVLASVAFWVEKQDGLRISKVNCVLTPKSVNCID